MTLDTDAIRALVEGEHGDAFAVLGPHRVQTPLGAAVAVRAMMPGAAAVRVLPAGASPIPMERLHPAGLFETLLPDRREPFAYRLEVTRDDHVTEIDDPYRFASILSDFDRHLLAQGTHYRAHEKLGAHRVVLDGVAGVAFLVWAPSARRVSVVGDFNGWIDCADWEQSVVSFLRRARDADDAVLVVCNFTPVPRHRYRVGVPWPGYYLELINSDAGDYGGSNCGNEGGTWAEPTPWQGQPHSVVLTLPPLAVLFLKRSRV